MCDWFLKGYFLKYFSTFGERDYLLFIHSFDKGLVYIHRHKVLGSPWVSLRKTDLWLCDLIAQKE